MSEETTPLLPIANPAGTILPGSNNRKRSGKNGFRYQFWVPVITISILFISFVSTFFLKVLPTLGDHIAEGTNFDLEDISFIGLTDRGGIDLAVQCEMFNNYTNIDDTVSRLYFQSGGFLLRKLNLKIDSIELLALDGNEKDALSASTDLGSVEIQPFGYQITDKSTNDLKLLVTVYPKSDSVLKIIKKMILDSDYNLQLKGDANVKILVFNGFIPVTNIMIPIDFQIPNGLIRRFNLDNFNIDDFKFSKDDLQNLFITKFNINSLINPFKNITKKLIAFVPKLPVLKIPDLKFKLNLYGCSKDELVPVSELSVRDLKFDFNCDSGSIFSDSQCTPINFEIESRTDEDIINSKLSKTCESNNNNTVLEKFINDIKDDGLVNFNIQGESIDSSYGGDFFNNLINKIDIPVIYKLDKLNDIINDKILKNVTMEDINFDFNNDDGSGMPMINGALKIYIRLPHFITLDLVKVDDLKGFANLTYTGEKFSDISITNWQNATTTLISKDDQDDFYNLILVESKLEKMTLNITDLDLFQIIVGQVLAIGSVPIDIHALIDILVGSILGSIELDGIPGSGSTTISR
ncbi:hypothetical protein BVG19_g2434 [[Candida] boidinii]|nr:hypothetical protein BVG19_g2434 [[Candida] boidinii]OWB49086.1 hypothetical protein B5S27_g625 [[Candida] boidinii]